MSELNTQVSIAEPLVGLPACPHVCAWSALAKCVAVEHHRFHPHIKSEPNYMSAYKITCMSLINIHNKQSHLRQEYADALLWTHVTPVCAMCALQACWRATG